MFMAQRRSQPAHGLCQKSSEMDGFMLLKVLLARALAIAYAHFLEGVLTDQTFSTSFISKKVVTSAADQVFKTHAVGRPIP
jgi:hypothetical protein